MKNFYALLFIGIVLAACNGPVPSPSPSPSPSPTPSVSPLPQFTHARGFIKPSVPGLHAGAPFVLASPAEAPVKFSWIAAGFDIPVHDQGNCGSCWAFSSTENLEWANLIFLGKVGNLSEQELVANNFSGCGGGDFAGDWMVSHGLVAESVCPYEASDRSCSALIPVSGQAVSYANIGTNGQSPTIQQIKEAMMEYGPLSFDVAAGGDFDNYTSGVMTGSDGNINHLVVGYGWDDALGTSGAWLVRNSWNASWGMQGNFEIAYGADSIASDVATVLVKPLIQYSQHPIPGAKK